MNYYRKKYKKWICTDESPVGLKLNQLNNKKCFVERRLKRNAKKEISSSDLINVLPRSKLSLVSGSSGTGKSTLAASMTKQWASGEKQFQLVLFLNSLQSTMHVTKLVWGEFACKLKRDTEWMVYQELEKMEDNILIIIDELGKLGY